MSDFFAYVIPKCLPKIRYQGGFYREELIFDGNKWNNSNDAYVSVD